MAELVFSMPGFAGDFSGAASVLSSMGGMVAMYGPTQCMKNYSSFDAPNWFSDPGMVFSTYMDEDDAIMGNYREITERISNTALKHRPDFVAVIGSPVSSMTGADYRGIAMDVEAATGIPSIGVETTGSHDYSFGIERTYAALADRFLTGGREPVPDSVNILGYSYLDYCDGSDLEALLSFYRRQGKKTIFVSGRDGVAEFGKLQNAELNVVASASGIRFAQYLEEVYGMEYTCDLPFGGEMPGPAREPAAGRCLFVGDQVVCAGLRSLFESRYGLTGDVRTFSAFDRRLARPGDRMLDGEADLRRAAEVGGYDAFVSDPLFMPFARCAFVPMPSPAVSSKLFWREHTRLFAEDVVAHADRFLGRYLPREARP